MTEDKYSTQYQEVEIKHKITSDLILDWYEKAETCRDPKKRDAMMVVIKVLSRHIGEYLSTSPVK